MPKDDQTQISIRIPSEVLRVIDALTVRMAPTEDAALSRADVLRRIVVRGTALFAEQFPEHGKAAKGPPKAAEPTAAPAKKASKVAKLDASVKTVSVPPPPGAQDASPRLADGAPDTLRARLQAVVAKGRSVASIAAEAGVQQPELNTFKKHGDRMIDPDKRTALDAVLAKYESQ